MNQRPDPNRASAPKPGGVSPSGSGGKNGAPRQAPGLMRNIGQFVGHVVQGITSDPGKPASDPSHAPKAQASATPTGHVVRHEVIERIQETPSGPIKVRRTIIEEEHEAIESPPSDVMDR